MLLCQLARKEEKVKKELHQLIGLSEYVDLWSKAEFTKMYDDYIVEASKEAFGKEEFIDRTEMLYKDLGYQRCRH